MLRKITIGALFLSLTLIMVSCTGTTSDPTPTPNAMPIPSGPIKAEWIEPEIVSGNTVSIPISEVKNSWNTHFRVGTNRGDINFMAYLLDGEIYVRANVCPPCRSIGYSLEAPILVCDRCATTFDAKTGDGIQGACVDYPKALVPYEITDSNITMKTDDLVTAYQNTLKPGWP